MLKKSGFVRKKLCSFKEHIKDSEGHFVSTFLTKSLMLILCFLDDFNLDVITVKATYNWSLFLNSFLFSLNGGVPTPCDVYMSCICFILK